MKAILNSSKHVTQKRAVKVNEAGYWDSKNPGVNKSAKRGVTKAKKKGRRK